MQRLQLPRQPPDTAAVTTAAEGLHAQLWPLAAASAESGSRKLSLGQLRDRLVQGLTGGGSFAPGPESAPFLLSCTIAQFLASTRPVIPAAKASGGAPQVQQQQQPHQSLEAGRRLQVRLLALAVLGTLASADGHMAPPQQVFLVRELLRIEGLLRQLPAGSPEAEDLRMQGRLILQLVAPEIDGQAPASPTPLAERSLDQLADDLRRSAQQTKQPPPQDPSGSRSPRPSTTCDAPSVFRSEQEILRVFQLCQELRRAPSTPMAPASPEWEFCGLGPDARDILLSPSPSAGGSRDFQLMRRILLGGDQPRDDSEAAPAVVAEAAPAADSKGYMDAAALPPFRWTEFSACSASIVSTLASPASSHGATASPASAVFAVGGWPTSSAVAAASAGASTVGTSTTATAAFPATAAQQQPPLLVVARIDQLLRQARQRPLPPRELDLVLGMLRRRPQLAWWLPQPPGAIQGLVRNNPVLVPPLIAGLLRHCAFHEAGAGPGAAHGSSDASAVGDPEPLQQPAYPGAAGIADAARDAGNDDDDDDEGVSSSWEDELAAEEEREKQRQLEGTHQPAPSSNGIQTATSHPPSSPASSPWPSPAGLPTKSDRNSTVGQPQRPGSSLSAACPAAQRLLQPYLFEIARASASPASAAATVGLPASAAGVSRSVAPALPLPAANGQLEASVHGSMEVFDQLLGLGAAVPPELLQLHLRGCLRSCRELQGGGQARLVRLVCVYAQNLVRHGGAAAELVLASAELQAFCIDFSRVRDATVLYRLLVGQQPQQQHPSPAANGVAPSQPQPRAQPRPRNQPNTGGL